jgi:hypothetical protein
MFIFLIPRKANRLSYCTLTNAGIVVVASMIVLARGPLSLIGLYNKGATGKTKLREKSTRFKHRREHQGFILLRTPDAGIAGRHCGGRWFTITATFLLRVALS